MTDPGVSAQLPILQPVIALVAWTCVMWVWMYATRNPAMMADRRIDLRTAIGFTGPQLDALLPARTQWKAHNYNHLHEQPTIFYATCLVLAIAGHGAGTGAALAWGYVAVRIVHSLYQSLFNGATIRFAIFTVATALQVALTIDAARAIVF